MMARVNTEQFPPIDIGDCEDISLTRRKRLMDAGLPEQALRIAVVETSGPETHAVLTVVTDKGDFVLDNLDQDTPTWNKSGYRCIERQNPTLPTGWASLAPRNPMVASTAMTDIRSIDPKRKNACGDCYTDKRKMPHPGQSHHNGALRVVPEKQI